MQVSPPRIACVVGTRPDAIKMAPVILELKRHPSLCEVQVIATGQHREMLAQVLNVFGIEADTDLEVMVAGQSLSQITTRCLERLDKALLELRPQFLLAQGDTTTTFCAGLAAFYQRIPFGHVEAGLRTDRIDDPFPEEFNRRAVAPITQLHFAPTREAGAALIREHVPPSSVFVTGNTGIDAVQWVAAKSETRWFEDYAGPIILLTTHRRENWGDRQVSICRAATAILEQAKDAMIVLPMHRNPAVREVLMRELGLHDRVQLIEPPDYQEFVKLLQRADLVLTDSGGIQEEAPAFGKPVLVLRETTERPEGVTSGNAILVGTDATGITEAALELLRDDSKYQAMATARSPYGDGRAAARIRYLVLRFLGQDSPEEKMWA